MSSLLECSSLLSVHLSGLRCQTGLHSVNRDTRPPRHHAGAFDVSLGLQRWAGLGWAGWAATDAATLQTRRHTPSTGYFGRAEVWVARRVQSSIPSVLPFDRVGQDMGQMGHSTHF